MEIYMDNARIFKGLGDPKRAMIVNMLSCGELCACMILGKFDMSQSTLSHHMKILCECGLVKAREQGKWIYYSLNKDTISRIMQFLCYITSDKENCICKEDEVCPHGVFSINGKKAQIEDKDCYMECGACAKNCPANAITVNTGVGCAAAVITSWLTGSEPSCDCSCDQECC